MKKKDDLIGEDEQATLDDKTQQEKFLKEHFELQISSEALDAHNEKEFIKSSMLSWSYIEEYYLPTFIVWLAKFHKLPLSIKIIDKANAASLIQYYYLLSHDRVLYEKLEKARKYRNRLIHNLYRSSSVDEIDKLAQRSSKFNLNLILKDIWNRESGDVHLPSTVIAVNARNDLRKEQRERMKKLLG